jgi:hypothetical protein
MEKLIRICDWTDLEIIKFNRCQIKMQVLTMANIIHGNGVALQQ